MTQRPFWIVFCPTGPTPPTVKHQDVGSATREAERLARAHRGQEFYVMESHSGFVVDDIHRIRFVDDDSIPF